MPADRSRLPALGPEPTFTFPDLGKHTLPNGFLLLLPVGAAADPVDRPGLAAVTGDLLDEGCGDRSAIDVHDVLGRMGAQFDTEVGADATILNMTTLSRAKERGLELLGDMVMRPRFEQKEFDRVRELRLNRLVQLRDMPPSVADRAFAQLIYQGHPYGHLAIGTEGSLRALTLKEVVGFHRRAYSPSRLTLIAVGDASHEALGEMARRVFGDWLPGATESGGEPFDAALAPPPRVPTERLALVHRAGAAQSELRIGHVATSRNTPDYHALLVLNMVLGGQFVSRINLKLREERGYTYGARTSFDFRRGPGPFALQVSVQTEVTVEAVAEALGELRAIRGDRPVLPHELALARAALTRGYPRSFETAEQITRAVAQLALYELPDDYFSQFVARVATVDAEAVTRAAEKYLDPSRILTVIVGDRERLSPSLPRLELGAASEVSMA
ncbi:MAG: insulinase family protein [Acidobacteria bacterium]|nr:insulinase family protein [Acidobacteriota bacterium]